MINYLKSLVTIGFMSLLFFDVCSVEGAGPLVSEIGNRHNLSSIGRNPGTTTLGNNTNPYRATGDLASVDSNISGRQVCIFCHTPHNANVAEQAPLWNRKFSTQTFQRYTGSSTFNIKNLAVANYGQPNGSSKLCLSCHDGVASIGEVSRGGTITMTKNTIDGLASFKPTTNKMRYGHHPVSFVYATGYSFSVPSVPGNPETQSGAVISGLPTDYVFPSLMDGATGKLVSVKLKDTLRNGNGWMQCTTCHDAHQNQSDDTDCYDGSGGTVTCDAVNTRKKAPFWVYHKTGNTASLDRDDVCKTCHNLNSSFTPWPQTP